MKLLVTGGAGYIGSVVALQLVESGHEVTSHLFFLGGGWHRGWHRYCNNRWAQIDERSSISKPKLALLASVTNAA